MSVNSSVYVTGLYKYGRSGHTKNAFNHIKDVRKYTQRREKRLSRWGIDTDVGEAYLLSYI